MKTYFVYLLTNYNNKVLYTGVTNNLLRRVYEHKNKQIDGFTKKYNVIRLVYFETFSDINEAIIAEKRIKGWTRQKKNLLVKSFNPDWNDLFPTLEENTITQGLGKDPSHRSG